MLDLVDFVFDFPFTEITGITITHITEERLEYGKREQA